MSKKDDFTIIKIDGEDTDISNIKVKWLVN